MTKLVFGLACLGARPSNDPEASGGWPVTVSASAVGKAGRLLVAGRSKSDLNQSEKVES
jgi:hypothetical protein